MEAGKAVRWWELLSLWSASFVERCVCQVEEWKIWAGTVGELGKDKIEGKN